MGFFSALLPVAGSLLGGLFGSNSGDDAAEAHERQLREAMGLIGDAGSQARTDQMPWYNSGSWANDELQNFMRGDWSGFYDSPAYQAAFSQGNDMLAAGAAAESNLFGGGAEADRIAYGQQLATQYGNNYYNQLMGLSSQGQGAAGMMGQIGMNTANALAGLHSDIGTTQASAHMNRGNQWQNALSGILGQGGRQGWW